MVKLTHLCFTLDKWLQPDTFSDYAPNGLQIEGKSGISRLGLAVSASSNVIDAAIGWKADALLVHHGFFWKGESPRLVGMKGKRVRKLMSNDLSLLSYHLPLDFNQEFGNNVTLQKKLNFSGEVSYSRADKFVLNVALASEISLEECVSRVSEKLDRSPLLIRALSGRDHLRKIAICTGAAQDRISVAHKDGMDLFISGEISERTTHEARELGVHYLAAGHHATERYGVQALGEKICSEFDISIRFFEEHNPA